MNSSWTIGYFTGLNDADYDLPHPHMGLPVILIVRQVIMRAFDVLRERKFSLATEQEDNITTALLNVIENDLRQRGSVPGFNKDAFEQVTRHHHTEDYKGEHQHKAPDLCFKLRSDDQPVRVLSTHHALFVECKPVDSDHSAGGDYCDKGLQRFVDGEYAWAMQDALMLAYARKGRSITNHLIPAMCAGERPTRLKIVMQPVKLSNPGARAEGNAETLHRSRHRRDFHWPHGKGQAVDITIYHSWHCCD